MKFDRSTIAWVLDDGELQGLVGALASADLVSFDYETTGLDEHATTTTGDNDGVPARIVLASFTIEDGTDRPTTWVLPLYHPESPWRAKEVPVMREVSEQLATCRLTGHNAKFDAKYNYARTGVDLSRALYWDTEVGAHLLDETQSRKLKDVAPRIFGIEAWDKELNLSFPGAALTIPLFDLGVYAAQDTFWTLQLAKHQMAILDPDVEPMFPDEVEAARLGLLAKYVSMPTVRSLTAMEQRGFTLDLDYAKKELAQCERAAHTLSEELIEEVPIDGDPSWAPTSNWFRAWTSQAVEMDKLRILSMTRKGSPQWSKSVLKKLARRGFELAEKLLELRTLTKRAEYLRSWMLHVTPTSRIHAQYNVGSVATGRLSSSSPNMQQVTRALRPCFVASPGHTLIDLDYSQIEMRVAAYLSRCEPMIEAFRRGEDTHTLMAAAITGKELADITPMERQSGKSANFGLLFSMSVTGFQHYAEDTYGVMFSDDEARDVHAAYFDLWDGLHQWHDKQRSDVRKDGQVTSPIGRIRRLPDIWGANEERVRFAERAAINSPVQGFASDLMQTAAALIEGVVPGFEHHRIPEARIVASVHDSVVIEVPEESWEDVAERCIAVMETHVLDVMRQMSCRFDVPIKADLSKGRRWGADD